MNPTKDICRFVMAPNTFLFTVAAAVLAPILT